MSTPPVDLRPGFERPIECQPDPTRERGAADAVVERQFRKIERRRTCRLERP